MKNMGREEQILFYLKENQAISVKELAGLVYASEATVRRDLKKLEADGRLHRFYGGVSLATPTDLQVPLIVREKEMGEGKRAVAKMARELIRDGQVLFLDGSSTSLCLVPLLAGLHNLTVITNGLKTARLLSELHINTYCTGGHLIENSQVFVGKNAIRFVEDYHADLCFFSCKGMTEDGLLTDTSESETELRKAFMEHSEKRVFLLTSNKIGRSYFHILARSEDLDAILCESPIPDLKLRNRQSD